ncbi:hypothetical protein [Paenibacillus bovis]|uniref:Uncharacterized protein n=1 Tax=Paenibacillus bovis TaxID=1616788 RepID=A0A1X9T453_9BACL|nr:hypothetical protein [Paenibacillus bovis]ARR10750.1 hypothetical protein AR543_p0142 [Paenibacillus bovis]
MMTTTEKNATFHLQMPKWNKPKKDAFPLMYRAEDEWTPSDIRKRLNRRLDKHIARTVGYQVEWLSDPGFYILIRPHSIPSVPQGGLYTVHGPGPQKQIINPFRSCIALTEEEAWDWVPCFSTNREHLHALLLHMKHDRAYRFEDRMDQELYHFLKKVWSKM